MEQLSLFDHVGLNESGFIDKGLTANEIITAYRNLLIELNNIQNTGYPTLPSAEYFMSHLLVKLAEKNKTN